MDGLALEIRLTTRYSIAALMSTFWLRMPQRSLASVHACPSIFRGWYSPYSWCMAIPREGASSRIRRGRGTRTLV